MCHRDVAAVLQHNYASNVWWHTMKSTRITMVLRSEQTQSGSHVLAEILG